MRIGFLTYYDIEKPYPQMAKELQETVNKHHPVCNFSKILIPPPGNGGDFFAEAMADLYHVFSRYLSEGPVILLDADCCFQNSIKPFLMSVQNEWDVAAVYRGRVSNSYGDHSFLSSVVIFNNVRPNVCRKFWLDWTALIYDFSLNPRPTPTRAISGRNEKFERLGWAQTWYADQAALNTLLSKHERVLRLSSDVFSSKTIKENTIISHQKGRAKLK